MTNEPSHAQSNIILIGMPGAGKSTLGVLLAKQLAKSFVDTDLLIQEQAGKTLQAILDDQGYKALRELEASVLCALDVHNSVVATGGSAVYSEAAMTALKTTGCCIYLRLSLSAVEQRVHNIDSRGIACPLGQTLVDVYAERQPLYERYADSTVDCDGKSVDQVVEEIASSFKPQATS